MKHAASAAAIIATASLSLSAIAPPRRIHHVKPVYPPESLRIGDEGAIVLELSVDASGAVDDIKRLWSGCPRLEKAAFTAARQWRYEPVRRNGTPAPFKILVYVPFRLPPEVKSRTGQFGACAWKEPPTPLADQS
jgi:protein TonB